MAQVIERIFGKEFGYKDLPSTYEKATVLFGRKLDRRKSYAIIKGEVCELAEWTLPCSGCSCDTEYPCSCCHKRGAGCEECGYTGKRRESQWVPLAK